MLTRPASIGLLCLAALVVVGCRTRLPVEPLAAVAASETTPRTATGESVGLTAFLRDGGSAERVSSDPMRPFLAEVKPDRLQDMVRMEMFSDRRGGPLGFLTECACVCVPGQDH